MDFDDIVDNNEENAENLNELMLFEDEKDAQFKSFKDVVIFLVDCSHSMTTEAIPKIMQVIESFLKTKIITNEKDLFSLILYNTQTENNVLKFEGINTLIGITEPDAKLIKEIKLLINKTNVETNPNYLSFIRDKFKPVDEGETPLNDALWICQTELKSYDVKKFNRRIFLFTDNDSPMSDNLEARKRTIQRGKDMLESEIILELFPMNTTKAFDMRKFFCDIITTENFQDDLVLGRGSFETRLRELSKRIRQKEIKKRTLGKCPFFLSKDIKFNVNFYASLHKATKPKSYLVDGRTNKNLSVVNHAICKDTGSVLYQNQIGTFHEYGGEKVIFQKDDMKKIKTLDEAGIKLMGFKDATSIKPYYNIRESYFIYPNEALSKGASQLCDALIKQMIIKDKVAIVKFIPREGATIRFCALFPQKEAFDEDYFQTPPGFNLVFLPYADDIRSNSDVFKKLDIEGTITNDQLNVSKAIIKKMNIEFDSRSFENPVIQKFFSTLQALALGEDETEKVEDLINPDADGLVKVLKGLDSELRDSIFEEGKGLPIPISTQRQKKAQQAKNGDGVVEEMDLENGNGHVNGNDDNLKRKKGLDDKDTAKKKKVIEIEELSDGEDKQDGKRAKKGKGTGGGDVEYSDEQLYKLRDEGVGLNKLSINVIKKVLLERNITTGSKEKKDELLAKLNKYLDDK